MNYTKGFSLVELVIALMIISLIAVGLMKASTIIENSEIKKIVSIVSDLREAISSFKERFKYFPGDILDAASYIENLDDSCNRSRSDSSSLGNGRIDADSEYTCAFEHLFHAHFIESADYPLELKIGDGITQLTINSRQASTFSGTTLPSVDKHVIQLSNLPTNIAVEIDSQLDDGNLLSGRVQSLVRSEDQDVTTSLLVSF